MAEWLNGAQATRSNLLIVEGTNIWQPSSVQNITAAGGITPTNPVMRVQGSGGAVTITANPQIVAGIDGQVLVIEGNDDTNTVTLTNGTGVHLHSANVLLGAHDTITLVYDASSAEWQESGRNAPPSEKAWSFDSPAGATGTFYFGGHYDFAAIDDDFSPGAVTFGTANESRAAHFFVVLGAVAVDEITITVTGTRIQDNGTRTPAYAATITIPNGTAVDSYFETSEKFLGQVSVQTTAGTAKTCNYGWCKYWDRNNSDFRVLGLEVTWLGGANDATPDLRLRHHKTTGWTFNAASTPTPPTPIAAMATDHNTEIQIVDNENGAWKRDNLNTVVLGSASEGTIWEIVTTANRAFELGNILLTTRAI